MLRKTIIFGNSGSGKSTLAKLMAQQHKLAHQATEPPCRKPLWQSKKTIELFMTENDDWVIEGCYADLLHWAVEHASQIIFMSLPIALCQQNARNRLWEPHKYNSKAAQDANLPMLLDWIAGYADRTDEFSYSAHASLYNQFSGIKQQITENQTTASEIST